MIRSLGVAALVLVGSVSASFGSGSQPIPPASGISGQAQAGKPPLSLDDVMRLRTVQEPQIAPDGSRVAYVVSTPDLEENAYDTDIWLVSASGGDALQLTGGPGHDRSPRWSPDGSRIAFVSDRDDGSQIWFIRPDGGEARRVSDSETSIQSCWWSPDGSKIAFTALEPEADAEPAGNTDDSLLFDRDFRLSQIFVLDVGSGEIEQVTHGNFTVTGLSWSPDADQLAFAAQPTPRIPDIYRSDIYALMLATGEIRTLVAQDGIDWQPKWSPDGTTIAFSSEDGTDDWIANNYISLVSADGGNLRNAGREHDGLVTRFEWSADSTTLFYSANQRVTRQIFALSAETGRIRQVTSGDRVHSSFSLSAPTDTMALLVQDPTTPWEVYVSPLDAFDPVRRTDTNPVVRERALGDVEVVRWSAKDGTEIEGLLMTPVGGPGGAPGGDLAGEAAGGRAGVPSSGPGGRPYPMLTYVHGGPASLFTLSFHPNMAGRQPVQAAPYPVHVLAGMGYAIFFPNPRGSNGYGEAFRMAVAGEWGYVDYDDIQSGIDELIERGIADPDRLGIMGWSYGGYMTAWTITQTDRFKAASVGAGITNIVSFYGQTDIPRYLERYLGTTPWDGIEEYMRRSAIFHVGNVATPTLIQHGERDTRVPLAQARELYQALSRRNIPVQLAVYPGQGHLISEPKLQLDMQQRNIDWFERWVRGVPAR